MQYEKSFIRKAIKNLFKITKFYQIKYVKGIVFCELFVFTYRCSNDAKFNI